MFPFIVTLLGELYEGFGVKESWNFYKVSWYLYIDWIEQLNKDTKGHSEFLIHPFPIGIFTLILLPFLNFKFKIAVWMFSLCNYWIENVFFIIGFFMYLIFKIPINYFYHLVACFEYFPNIVSIKYLISWLFLGIPVLTIYLFVDTYWFYEILKWTSISK